MKFRYQLCVLVIAGMLVASCSGKKQPASITQITDPSYVTGIASDGETAWCATRGGLVEWNLKTRAYTVYTTADGLPGNVLSDVALDGKNRVWVASDAGIAVREGSGWKVFDSRNGLKSDRIIDLAVDREGVVWAATAGGVVSFPGGRPKVLGDKEGPGETPATNIYFDLGKNIWIGTPDNGIFTQLQGTWRHLTTKNGLLLNTSFTITQDWDNSVWSASSSGVSRWDGQGFQSFGIKKFTGTYDIRDLIGNEGNMWYFTANGVHVAKGSGWRHITEVEGLISNNVVCGSIDKNGAMYAGTAYGMSVIGKDLSPISYSIPNTPFGCNFVSLAVDARGRLLAVADSVGVNVRDSGAWNRLGGECETQLKTTRSITFGPDSTIVFNTGAGLVVWNRGGWKTHTRTEGIAGEDVRCGVYDRDGRYWAGTSTGVSCLAGGAWERYREGHGLPSENVWTCAADSSGMVWFGTSRGIVSFAKNEITNWAKQINAGSDTLDVRSSLIYGGKTYFGTMSGKLIAYDGAKWSVSSKSKFCITAIMADPSGAIWLGTDGGGIVKAEGGAAYTVADGLPSNFVRSLAMSDGRMIAACCGGLAEVSIGGK